jgi:1,4-alpha-glucan branching enzyme
MNYNFKTYGFSYPSATHLVFREWVPNAQAVFLLGDFNSFNEDSHPMHQEETEKDIFSIELNLSKEHIQE